MSKVHALRPSSSPRWSTCTASPAEIERAKAALLADHETAVERWRENAALFDLSDDSMPVAADADDSSEASRWGTGAHLISETVLLADAAGKNEDVGDYLGATVYFVWHSESDSSAEFLVKFGDPLPADIETGYVDTMHEVVVDEEMVECAAVYVDYVRAVRDLFAAEIEIEQRVPIAFITGEPGAGGTTDSIAVIPMLRELRVIDLKGGFIQVLASHLESQLDASLQQVMVRRPNTQLVMYAAGALHARPELREQIDTVRLVIVQPRVSTTPSEHVMTLAELDAEVELLRQAAERTRTAPEFKPSVKACRFCPVSVECKAYRDEVMTLVGFENLDADTQPRVVPADELGLVYSKLDLIKLFMKNVTEAVRSRLESGQSVIGPDGEYQIVEARQGARYWTDEDEVAATLRHTFRLPEDVVFKKKLATPAQIEALGKKKRGSKEKPVLGKHQIDRVLSKTDRRKPVRSIVVAGAGKKKAPVAVDGFQDLTNCES